MTSPSKGESKRTDVRARMHQLIVSGEINCYLHRTGFYRPNAAARTEERQRARKAERVSKWQRRRLLVPCTAPGCHAACWKSTRSQLCRRHAALAREQRKRVRRAI